LAKEHSAGKFVIHTIKLFVAGVPSTVTGTCVQEIGDGKGTTGSRKTGDKSGLAILNLRNVEPVSITGRMCELARFFCPHGMLKKNNGRLFRTARF